MDMDSQPLSAQERFKQVRQQMDSSEQPNAEQVQETEPLAQEQEDIQAQTVTDEEVIEETLTKEVELDQLDGEEEFEIADESGAELDLEATYIVDGEEITGEQLKTERMRQADYTRKTQQLAEERKIVEADHARAQQNLEAAVTALGVATSQIDQQLAQFQNTDWARLANEVEPQKYNQMQAQAQSLMAQKQQFEQQVQGLIEQHSAQVQEQEALKAQKAGEYLRSNIPNWNNQLYSDLQKLGTQFDYSEEEMLNMTDGRVFRLLSEVKKMQSAKKVATKKKVKRSPTKTIERGASVDVSSIQNVKTAQSKLRESGSINDAANAFSALRRK